MAIPHAVFFRLLRSPAAILILEWQSFNLSLATIELAGIESVKPRGAKQLALSRRIVGAETIATGDRTKVNQLAFIKINPIIRARK